MPSIRFEVSAKPSPERGCLLVQIDLFLPVNPDNGGLLDELRHNDVYLWGEHLSSSWGVYRNNWRTKTTYVSVPERVAHSFLKDYLYSIKNTLQAVFRLHKEMATTSFNFEVEEEIQ